VEVRGCSTLDCRNGSEVLGTYPEDFVQTVKAEGTGRITSGARAGQYLNWSINIGFWLDTLPRDARGLALRPFLTAAADVDIPYVTPLRIADCGVDAISGDELDPGVCEQFTGLEWVVRDRFTQGHVGKHIDLYIGEEDQPNFVPGSPKAIHVTNATITMGEPPTGQ
jgi:hypothetical protein